MPKYISWIPTQSEYINTFFDLCPLSSSDVVYDLGSGDGRLLFAAREMGAGKCIGIYIAPDRVKIATEAALNQCIEDIKFIEADVMDIDLSPATGLYPSRQLR